jgi:hypothetical protein
MAVIIKPLGNEQTFTTANSFSSSNGTVITGWNVVRVVNTGNTSQVVTVFNGANGTQIANLSVLPYTEVLVQKAANNLVNASSSNLLGVLVAYNT